MNREELKRELWSIANSRQDLKLKIQFYKDLILEMGGNDYSLDGLPRGNKISNPVLDRIISVERYEEEIQKIQAKLDYNIHKFEAMLAGLDTNEMVILRLRYMMGVRWDYINQQIAYSRNQARRIHDKALDKIIKNMVRNGTNE